MTMTNMEDFCNNTKLPRGAQTQQSLSGTFVGTPCKYAAFPETDYLGKLFPLVHRLLEGKYNSVRCSVSVQLRQRKPPVTKKPLKIVLFAEGENDM